ncbi:MAG: hypothetical protein ACXAE3_00055 [Candidatus Kariarchaeaceae archaeon]|jgi:hypothetical protein
MATLQDFVESFRRLNPGLENFRIDIKDENITILCPQNIVDAIPPRIVEHTTSLTVHAQSQQIRLDLRQWRLRQLGIVSSSSVATLSVECPPGIDTLSLAVRVEDSLVITGIGELEDLFIGYHHLEMFPLPENLSKISVWISNEDPQIINLDRCTVKSVEVIGNVDRQAEAIPRTLVPSKFVESLSINRVQLDTLDLTGCNPLEELHLVQVNGKNHQGFRLTLPDYLPRLKSFTSSRVLFEKPFLMFSGRQFPSLETLVLSEDMNSKVIVRGINSLKTLKNTTERHLVGFTSALFLCNLPSLSSVTTDHQVIQKVWNCPVVSEFGNSIDILTEEPEFETDTF